jgi:hypothetical protein
VCSSSFKTNYFSWNIAKRRVLQSESISRSFHCAHSERATSSVSRDGGASSTVNTQIWFTVSDEIPSQADRLQFIHQLSLSSFSCQTGLYYKTVLFFMKKLSVLKSECSVESVQNLEWNRGFDLPHCYCNWKLRADATCTACLESQSAPEDTKRSWPTVCSFQS